MASKLDRLARLETTGPDAWRRWLEEHHASSEGIWLVRYKKGHASYVPYDLMVEEALCFGWIDGLHRPLDGLRTIILMTPRKSRSGWSPLNKRRIARLTRDGRMAPAGQARIAAAKRDGTWRLLDDIDRATVPDDLAVALAAHPGARANFDAFPPSTRKGILNWISQAVRPETRTTRIARTSQLAAENRRINDPRDSKPPAAKTKARPAASAPPRRKSTGAAPPKAPARAKPKAARTTRTRRRFT